MSNFTNSLAGFASLVLAAVPLATVATGAYAGPAQVRVQIADLDLNSAPGLAAFQQRVDVAAQSFCRNYTATDRVRINAVAPCIAGVKAEMKDKLAVAQIAQQTARAAYASR